MTRLLRLTLILSLIFVLDLLTLDFVSAQDQFFDSNGVRIRYVDQGAGQPVLLIHGYTGSIESSWVETGVLHALKVVVIEGATHGGERGAPRRPEFVDNLREFIAAHQQTTWSSR